MPDLKHIGRVRNSKRRAVIAYRTIPGDPYHALVVYTDLLSDLYHNDIMRLLESPAGQDSYEFSEIMMRSSFTDGKNMLSSLHEAGRLVKISTKEIEMTPNTHTVLGLDQLNDLIASQNGVSIEDISVKPVTKSKAKVQESTEVQEVATVNELPNTVLEPLSDADLARKYRSDADRLSKEAAQLRRMAEELVPTKKKTTDKSEA